MSRYGSMVWVTHLSTGEPVAGATVSLRKPGKPELYTATTGVEGLASETPVYRGNVTPQTSAGRTAASVGWLHEVVLPGVLLKQVLQGHPGEALRLHFHFGPTSVTFTSGTGNANPKDGS